MSRNVRLLLSVLGAITLASGLGLERVAAAAPLELKPLKIAVTDFDCLNRDNRGAPRQNRKFFTDILVQALAPASNLKVEHVDTPARQAVDDVRLIDRYDLSLGGDYIQMLNGSYRINLRLYDIKSRAALSAWSAEALDWRSAYFEGKEEIGGPPANNPALATLADRVREMAYAVQLWRAARSLANPASGLAAEIKCDPPARHYRISSRLSLWARPNADIYLTVLSLSSTGGARVLFPRPKEESPRVGQNEMLQIPGSDLTLRVTDQVGSGEDCFKVIMTKQPLSIDSALREPNDTAGTIALLEAIGAQLGARPADSWGTSTCVIKVVDK